MKIIFQDFIIEDDTKGYILSKMGKVPERNKKGEINKKAGEDYIVSQVYPSTLERCFEYIYNNYKKEIDKEINISELIENLKQVQKEFLLEMKNILKK